MVELSLGTWRVTIWRKAPETMDLIRMYDSAAWMWHPIVRLLGYSRIYANLFTKLTTDGWIEDLRDGAKVLDGGIGTGAFSMALAKTIPNSLEIHGIDIAPRMLARARDNLQRLGRSNLTSQLRYGNVDSLPYSVGDFDMVMSAHMLEHSANPSETIKEMVRVLRVGAPLLIVTTRTNRISSLHSLRWRYRFIASQQLQQWMCQAGLCDVQCYALDGGLSLLGPLSEAYIGRKIMPDPIQVCFENPGPAKLHCRDVSNRPVL